MSTDTTTAVTASLVRTDGTALRPTAAQASSVTESSFQKDLLSATRQTAGAQNSPLKEQELPPREEVGEEEVAQAVEKITSFVQTLQRDLQFEVDLDLGQTVISVVDRETKEVIRQIPREEAVERARRLQEQGSDSGSAGGLLLKVQA